MTKTDRDPRQTLATILAERPDLVAAASAIFDYTQYLLDDDERLTKSGALDGVGRELLGQRALETLGGPAPAAEADDRAGLDEEVDDDEGDEDSE